MDRDDVPHDPTGHDPGTPHYDHPHGGWGSVQGIVRAVLGEAPAPLAAARALERLNKPGGVMCNSCAWAKPRDPGALEICENGAKAVFSELTRARCTPEVLGEHTLETLRTWSDHDLEHLGRLTHPVRYDAATDGYVAVGWAEAFTAIGAALQALDPQRTVFYASGHAALEPAFLYQLFARAYGHNHLPQSSNMCHETTSVGLKRVIGSAVGTCTLDDFDHVDAIFVFGQNPGTNSPRFLKPLQEVKRRGGRIVVFNPVREAGLLRFADPQSPAQMTVSPPTDIADLYLQVRPGGDIAAIAGLLKHVLAAEDDAPGTVLDHAFLAEHTEGADALFAAVRAMDWASIEHHAGLSRDLLAEAADLYLAADAVIGVYGMGLTQHVHGADNLGMLVNLLLARGHIGRPGAGITPVRGHSNVQGQRTVGIAEKPELVPLDRMEALFGLELPRTPGRNAVAACEGLLDGSVDAMISLGGNLVRALPDRERIEAAWSRLKLTVSVATKLNRTHLVPGDSAWILPCLGRLERNVVDGVEQAVSVEDTFSHIHGSVGRAAPVSDQLLSETAIVCGLAAATLPPNHRMPWHRWAADHAAVRALIEQCWPDDFHDYEARLFQPGGFYRGNPARERIWKTDSGRALLTVPSGLSALGGEPGGDVLTLITLRSNDQFNTTVYGFRDRLRGLAGSRWIALLAPAEIARRGLSEGQRVHLVSAFDDGAERRVHDLEVRAFDLPAGCIAGYFPELNPLVPLGLHDERSQTPAYKGAPVRIVPATPTPR